MLREMLIGSAAGRIGMVALNALTYGDMALRGRPARELKIIKDHLAPGGSLYLVYQPLVAHEARETVETLSAVLENHGFMVSDALDQDLSTGREVRVIAE